MIFKIKRKIVQRLWRETFYFYLKLDDWLKRHPAKPKVTIDVDRNSREVDTYIERTIR